LVLVGRLDLPAFVGGDLLVFGSGVNLNTPHLNTKDIDPSVSNDKGPENIKL
jgi:hypothetical protein